MQEIRLWSLTAEANNKPKPMPVTAINQTETEQLLEEALTALPDLLVPGLTLVGRQTETAGGPLDLLGVDEDGRLVVFELKRGQLTREAVAQAIDYASYLAGLTTEELSHRITQNSGQNGIEQIDDFSQWYQSRYQQPVAEIGVPKIVLVGLGVDEKAKRIVEFLAKFDLDISLITFYGFKEGSKTFLARQLEVKSRAGSEEVKSTKLENKAKLDKLITSLGIKSNYDALTAVVKKGLDDSAYQWPNPPGYSFSLPALAESGKPTYHAYIALYTSEKSNGKVYIVLQARAIEAASVELIKELAQKMGSHFVLKPSGYGEIVIDCHKPASEYELPLFKLAQEITAGWKKKREDQTKIEAEELVHSS